MFLLLRDCQVCTQVCTLNDFNSDKLIVVFQSVERRDNAYIYKVYILFFFFTFLQYDFLHTNLAKPKKSISVWPPLHCFLGGGKCRVVAWLQDLLTVKLTNL